MKHSQPILEREASYFAMCILMPEHLVKREIEKMGRIDLADDNLLKALAKIFDVPLNAMAVRLSQIYPRESKDSEEEGGEINVRHIATIARGNHIVESLLKTKPISQLSGQVAGETLFGEAANRYPYKEPCTESEKWETNKERLAYMAGRIQSQPSDTVEAGRTAAANEIEIAYGKRIGDLEKENMELNDRYNRLANLVTLERSKGQEAKAIAEKAVPPDDYPISGFVLAKLGFEYDYHTYTKGGVCIAGEEGELWRIFKNGNVSEGVEKIISTVGELRKYLSQFSSPSSPENKQP